jgi:hypothetical protein
VGAAIVPNIIKDKSRDNMGVMLERSEASQGGEEVKE